MKLRFAEIDLESTLIEDTRTALAERFRQVDEVERVDLAAVRIVSLTRSFHAIDIPVLEGRKICGHLHARGGVWAFRGPLRHYAALALADGTVVEWVSLGKEPRAARAYWNVAEWCEIQLEEDGIHPLRAVDGSGAVLAEILAGTVWQTMRGVFGGGGSGRVRLGTSGREVPGYDDLPGGWSFAALPFPEASQLSREEQLLCLTLRLVTVVAADYAEG